MKVGDWQIDYVGGEEAFLLCQKGVDLLLHYKGNLRTEDEVQDFVRGHGLTLLEETSTNPGFTRIYTRNGQADSQALFFIEVERYRRKA